MPHFSHHCIDPFTQEFRPFYLTDAQPNLLTPAAGAPARNDATVPTSNRVPFVNAACWGWALNGEYVNANDPYAATPIYNSDEGAFTSNAQRVLISQTN